MIGLTISVINYEIDCYAGSDTDAIDGDETEVYSDPMDNPRNANQFTNPLRYSVLFMSLVSIIFNFLRYRQQIKGLEMQYEDGCGSDST